MNYSAVANFFLEIDNSKKDNFHSFPPDEHFIIDKPLDNIDDANEHDYFEIETTISISTYAALKEIAETWASPIPEIDFAKYIFRIVQKLELIVKEIHNICPEIDDIIEKGQNYSFSYRSVEKHITSDRFGVRIFDSYRDISFLLYKLKSAYKAEIEYGSELEESIGYDSNKPQIIDKIAHRFVLLHRLGIVEHLQKRHFKGLSEVAQARIMTEILGLPVDKAESIRNHLRTYKEKDNNKNPLTPKAIRAVDTFLHSLGLKV